LPATIGVDLVKNEEPEPLGCVDELIVPWACEDQLEHHVVREEDVRGAGDDLLALLVRLLAGVAAERDRRATCRVASAQELLELANLTCFESSREGPRVG
jgi:hypothetical protein